MQVKEIAPRKTKLLSQEEKNSADVRIKKLQKEGEKLVKGMFEFLDAQGGWLDFSYRFFPGENVKTIRINHGEIVELPMVLVKHLNNVWKKVRIPNRQMTEDGRFIGAATVERVSRTRFTPVDLM